MTRTVRLLALGITAAALAGCTKPPLTNGPEQAFDVEKAYPITVEPQVATLVVKVDDGLQSLGRGEEGRIRAFVENWKSRGQGMLNAAAPDGENRAATAAAMNELKKLLAGSGVDKNSVQYTNYKPAGDDALAPITLSYVTYAASAAECGGDWSENLGFTPRNQPWPDFGCSSQHNFAAIVADPRDLIEPRTTDPASAARRGTVIENYGMGKGTETVVAEDQKQAGQVSNVDTGSK